jgi:plasmid stabilization system protein ParE
MKWRIISRPGAENDIADAAAWYEEQQPGLGGDLVLEVQATYAAISENPFLNSKRHRRKPVRWRVTRRFPYRVIYEVLEEERCIVVIAVLHAARHDRQWLRRVE